MVAIKVIFRCEKSVINYHILQYNTKFEKTILFYEIRLIKKIKKGIDIFSVRS